MKLLWRSILISALTLAAINLPAGTPAQTTLAIRGGLSRATLSGLPMEGVPESALKARTGLSLGASTTFPVQDNFGLRLDGGYVQKGYRAEQQGLEADFHIDYIELSGLGSVNLTPTGSSASANLLLGPSFAFKTGCEASATISLGGETSSVSESCGDDVRGIDLGITGGVGLEMAVSEQMSLLVDLRYTLGLLSADETGEEDIKNRNLLLQVGVGFPIGELNLAVSIQHRMRTYLTMLHALGMVMESPHRISRRRPLFDSPSPSSGQGTGYGMASATPPQGGSDWSIITNARVPCHLFGCG